MDHVDKSGTPKFRKSCTLPLTGRNVVDMIITNLAVFRRADRQSAFELIALAPGTTAQAIRECTEADYRDMSGQTS
jgi:acyl CoA:acetate/3-ketoacid CoA transferase beta subunit